MAFRGRKPSATALKLVKGNPGKRRRSIEIAKKQRSKAWELRATTSLARLYQSQKRHAEGRDMLSDLYSTFSEGLRTPDLEDAQRLLDELRLPG